MVNPPTSLIPIKPNSSQETLQPTQYNTQTQGNISNQQGSQASQEENITNLSPAKPVYDSETGHYYDQIDGSFTWDAAKIASEKSTLEVNGDLYKGHLATITTPAENDFIVGKFNISRYWLGGFQPANSQEPAGGWQWVTNESWSYTNWFIGDLEGDPEPNNFDERENLLVGWYHNQWNDFPNNAVGNDFFSTDGYIVEYEPEQIL